MAKEWAKAFYKSKAWQQVRESILKRDLYLCVKCGNPAEEVHHKIHLSPSNINNPKITLNASNLMSLCRDCHFAIHKEDKIRGLKEKNKSAVCSEEYCFDENGFLVRRNTDPPNSNF